jgi:membrane protein YqaA with SNARE-associated domain
LLRNITNFLVAAGPWGLLLLAIIDSAGLPVANGLDAYLIFLSVKEPDRAYHYAAISVAGSVAGNVILYFVARRGGRRFQQRVEPDRKHRFRRWFERFGLVTVFVPAFIPIPMPLKLFVISAGALRTRFLWFLTVIVLARIPRYFGEAWLGAKMGRESTRFLKEHVWHFAAGAIILFGVLYLLVIANDRWRRRRRPALQ